LAALGFDAEWHCIPASAIGAPHIRDRVWIVAYPNGNGLEKDTDPQNLCGKAFEAGRCRYPPMLDRSSAWDGARPNGARVFRVDNGVSSDVDRIRALGNAVVPQIPELIGRAILASQRSAA
jgi:DNA (cytosine-5)-methyltransferase 1